MRLNKAGELVYHHAKDILNLYTQMDRLIEDLQHNASGSLIVGASFTFGEYVLPHIIASFRLRYPKITPMISIDNTRTVVDKVSRGELDIGIIEGQSQSQEVDIESFAKDTVAIVSSIHHPLAAKKEMSKEQLESETWIIREKGSGTREITDYVFSTYSIKPKVIIEYSSTQVIKESVEAGLGLSVLSTWVVRKELKWGTLCLLPMNHNEIHRQFSMVVRKSDFQTKATKVFQSFLREETQGITQSIL